MKNDRSCQKKEKKVKRSFDQKDDLILSGERSEVDDYFFFEKNPRRHSSGIFRSITVPL
jgi:hypothetical protein